MSFRITGLSPALLMPLYGLSEENLSERGIKRYISDSNQGYPDRIELHHAEPGESVLLLNYPHQSADTPYRASHAIFVREGASIAYDDIDTVPNLMRILFLSRRGLDANHMMVFADLTNGRDMETVIENFLPTRRLPIFTPIMPNTAATPPA